MGKRSLEKIVLLTFASLFASPQILAQATLDSTTWEGFYEADVLPNDDGWQDSGASSFTSLGTGPDAGTITLNNLTSGSGVFGLWEMDAAFNFTTGSSFEFRAKVNDPLSGANAMWFNIHDGVDDVIALRLFGAGQAQISHGTSFGFVSLPVDVSQYNTYRISIADGTDNVNVYINDNPTPVNSGTLEHAGDSPQKQIYFGDGTGAAGQQSDWSIDYIRWTNQGAFEFFPGDFTDDQIVDSQDLAAWEAGYGTSGTAVLSDGDADVDGDVDGEDFLIWQRNFSPVAPLSAVGSSIPEPASGLLLIFGAISLLSYPRRSS